MTVADDGIGLPAELDPERGSSLGLNLVFALARQIEAEVHVERTLGTTFRLSLGRRAEP